MALEQVPAVAPAASGEAEGDAFWFSYIDEDAAAEFLGLTDRTLQARRQKGGGPRYYQLSSRCIRYRRCDLRDYAEALVRTSTVDPEEEAA